MAKSRTISNDIADSGVLENPDKVLNTDVEIVKPDNLKELLARRERLDAEKKQIDAEIAAVREQEIAAWRARVSEEAKLYELEVTFSKIGIPLLVAPAKRTRAPRGSVVKPVSVTRPVGKEFTLANGSKYTIPKVGRLNPEVEAILRQEQGLPPKE